MNVYELSFSHIRHFVAAKDEEHAREQGQDPEKFPDLHFRPFDVTLVEVEGHTITVKPDSAEASKKRGRPSANAEAGGEE